MRSAALVTILAVAVAAAAGCAADPSPDDPIRITLLDGLTGAERYAESVDPAAIEDVVFPYERDGVYTTDPLAWTQATTATFMTHDGGYFRLERQGATFAVIADEMTAVRLPRFITWSPESVELTMHDRSLVLRTDGVEAGPLRARVLASLTLLVLDARAGFAEMPRHAWVIPPLIRYTEVLAFHYKTFALCSAESVATCNAFFAACSAKCTTCSCQATCSCFSIFGFFSSCELSVSVVADHCNVPATPASTPQHTESTTSGH